jgi:hypothetical protein
LALSLLGVSSFAGAATLEGAPRLRASLDDDAVATGAPAARRIRHTLDDPAVGVATFPADGSEPLVLRPLPPRTIRVSLDRDPPAYGGRLIRLSLDDDGTAYGRLSASAVHGRRVRTTLD